MPLRRAALLLLLAAAWPAAAVASQADAAWDALRSGGVALMRHALAPGTGDPPGLRLDDCATQRTLSPEGRAQARRIGAAFRAEGIAAATVLSSAWCRARETAALLDLGPVGHHPALDSVFRAPERHADTAAALDALVAGWAGPGPLVLVTHQVNVTALTRVFPSSGEVVVLRPGPHDGTAAVAAPAAAGRVVGRLRPAAAPQQR